MTTAEKAAVARLFDDAARTQWTNLPVGMAKRPGMGFGALSSESKTKLYHVLATWLSSQGYPKRVGLMNVADALNEIYEEACAEKRVT